jgi:hypothetical protein
VYNIQTREDNLNNGLTHGKQHTNTRLLQYKKSKERGSELLSFGQVDDSPNRGEKKIQNFNKLKVKIKKSIGKHMK